MSESIFFNEEDLIYHPDYNTAVQPNALFKRLEGLCVYEQDYTYTKAINLEVAEEILMAVRDIMRKR